MPYAPPPELELFETALEAHRRSIGNVIIAVNDVYSPEAAGYEVKIVNSEDKILSENPEHREAHRKHVVFGHKMKNHIGNITEFLVRLLLDETLPIKGGEHIKNIIDESNEAIDWLKENQKIYTVDLNPAITAFREIKSAAKKLYKGQSLNSEIAIS